MTWDGYLFKQRVREQLSYPLSNEVDNQNHPLGAALNLINSVMINHANAAAVSAIIQQFLPPPPQNTQQSEWDAFSEWANKMQSEMSTLQKSFDQLNEVGGIEKAVREMKSELESRFNSQLEAAKKAMQVKYAEDTTKLTQEMGTLMISVMDSARAEFIKQITDVRAGFMAELKTL